MMLHIKFTFENDVANVVVHLNSYVCLKRLIFGEVQKAIAMLGAESILASGKGCRAILVFQNPSTVSSIQVRNPPSEDACRDVCL